MGAEAQRQSRAAVVAPTEAGIPSARMAAVFAEASYLAVAVSDVEQMRERAMIRAEREFWEQHMRAKGWR